MNPFRFGQIVKEADFCRRPVLVEKLAENIKRGQNVYIQGERRIGKTSLIFEVVRSLLNLKPESGESRLKRSTPYLTSALRFPAIFNNYAMRCGKPHPPAIKFQRSSCLRRWQWFFHMNSKDMRLFSMSSPNSS